MQESYLEVTFRHGRPLAAYYHLPRDGERKAHRTQRLEHGLVVDFDEDGAPIGIEITSPSSLTLEAFNAVLVGLGCEPVADEDFAPLQAA
jgi:uncharacterized protein YuzE